MTAKATSVYTFYVVDSDGYISEEHFVQERNTWGEESYYRFPRNKHDAFDNQTLNCDMYEERDAAVIESNRIIEEKISRMKKEISSIESQIVHLEERLAANLD